MNIHTRSPFTLLMLVFATLFGLPLALFDTEHGQAHAEETSTLWTCSMHPQILEDAPGPCPICGMDLVPKQVAPTESGDMKKPASERKIQYWVAPMDPRYRRDGPGKSPMGMDLVPVYEGGGKKGLIEIDPVVVQNMGVRIARVRRGRVTRQIRTVGTVRVAEDKVSVVNLRFSGWIEQLRVNETGVHVEKGQALFDVYSPELVSAQQEYLLALRTGSESSPLARSAQKRLELYGLSGAHIRRLRKKRALRTNLTVRAPRSGYVVHKNVVEGARVAAGQDLYRIADLSQVWIEAEVYEHDAPWLRVDAPAKVALSFQPGESIESRIAYIYPTLDERTHTLRVRLELPNPDLALKPGSLATIDIEGQRRDDVLVIPTEAILHSGARKLVFVAIALGRYEAREIVTGLVGDKHVTEVREQLQEGERVVTSGQFLLDSESQLQEAVQKMLAARLDAQAAHAPEGAAGEKSDAHDGHDREETAGTYWTCSMHPQVVADEPGPCPICGMDLVEKKR